MAAYLGILKENRSIGVENEGVKNKCLRFFNKVRLGLSTHIVLLINGVLSLSLNIFFRNMMLVFTLSMLYLQI